MGNLAKHGFKSIPKVIPFGSWWFFFASQRESCFGGLRCFDLVASYEVNELKERWVPGEFCGFCMFCRSGRGLWWLPGGVKGIA